MEYDKTHKNNNTNSANKIPLYAARRAAWLSSEIDFFLMKRFPVLCRRNSFITFEQFHKIFLVRKSAHICHFIDGKCAVGEQILGDGDPDTVDIG